MAITNGYLTLDEFKDSVIPDNKEDAKDDTVLEDIIENTSRFIDGETNRTFFGNADTLEFDTPNSRELEFGKDLISITTLTNGDDTEISSDDYILIPANSTPYYAVKLKQSSSVGWTLDSSGNSEQVITLEGSWGYSTTAPNDIRQACLDISTQAYNRRTGTNNTGQVTITAAGVIISPQDVPAQARRTLNHYRRRY